MQVASRFSLPDLPPPPLPFHSSPSRIVLGGAVCAGRGDGGWDVGRGPTTQRQLRRSAHSAEGHDPPSGGAAHGGTVVFRCVMQNLKTALARGRTLRRPWPAQFPYCSRRRWKRGCERSESNSGDRNRNRVAASSARAGSSSSSACWMSPSATSAPASQDRSSRVSP